MDMMLEGEREEANNGYCGKLVSIDLPGECLGGMEDGSVLMWLEQGREGGSLGCTMEIQAL